jgi:hypothetical protein
MTKVRGTPCVSMVVQPIRMPFMEQIPSDEFRRYREAPVVVHWRRRCARCSCHSVKNVKSVVVYCSVDSSNFPKLAVNGI